MISNVRPENSYFMQKIAPILVTALVSAVSTSAIILITLYFTVGTLGNRVSALENSSVRADILAAELTPINQNVSDIKIGITSLRQDFNTYIINKSK